MKTPKRLQLVAHGEPSDVIELNTVSEPVLGQEDVLVSMEAAPTHRTFCSSVASPASDRPRGLSGGLWYDREPGHGEGADGGVIIFGITGALFGEITIKDGRVEQNNFNDHRILRINEAPVVEVHLVKSAESPGGIGEPGTSAIAPAVTNAIFAATGKRVWKLPVKPDQLRST